MISIPIWLFTLILCLLALLIGMTIGFAINPKLQDPKETQGEQKDKLLQGITK